MILIAYPNMATTLTSFQFEYWVGDIEKLEIGDDGWTFSKWYDETFVENDAEVLFYLPIGLIAIFCFLGCYCCFRYRYSVVGLDQDGNPILPNTNYQVKIPPIDDSVAYNQVAD